MITLQERVHGKPPPPNWNLSKLHHVFRVRKGPKNAGMQEDNLLSLSYGRIVQKDINTTEGLLPQSFETYQVAEPGNIVLRLTDLQNDKRSLRQGLVKRRGIITSAYDILEVERGHDPRFWAYALLALDLAKYYYSLGGGVRQSIKFADFPNDWLGTPCEQDQRAIADFLDRETARVERLIAEKGRLLALLNEKRAALIERAIVQDGPETRLGHHVEILSGYAFPSAAFSTDSDDIPLLRGVNVCPGRIRWEETVYWPRHRVNEVSRFLLSSGDVVLGMDRPWISTGIRVAELRESDAPSLLLQRVCRIAPRHGLDKGFMKLLLSSRRFRGYFEPILTGVSVPHISSGQVRAFRFNYVNIARQRAVAESVERASSFISSLVELIEESLKRTQEFRSALVTAAITGQIDVQNWSDRGVTDQILDNIEDESAAPPAAIKVGAHT